MILLSFGGLNNLPQETFQSLENSRIWHTVEDLFMAIPLWGRIAIGVFVLVVFVVSRWLLPALAQWRAAGRR